MVVRVLVADVLPVYRAGIRQGLASQPELEAVGEASNDDETQRLLSRLSPDLLLIDPGILGAGLITSVVAWRQGFPALAILVLSSGDSLLQVRALLGCGVAGYVLKSEPIEAILSAIKAVMSGGCWISRSVAELLLQEDQEAARIPTTSVLTGREMEVLNLIASGQGNDAMARALGISERTVRFHLRNLYDKLNVSERDQLIAWAAHQGIDRLQFPARRARVP